MSAETETEISYMTYRWDEEQEERIDINATTVEQDNKYQWESIL